MHIQWREGAVSRRARAVLQSTAASPTRTLSWKRRSTPTFLSEQLRGDLGRCPNGRPLPGMFSALFVPVICTTGYVNEYSGS